MFSSRPTFGAPDWPLSGQAQAMHAALEGMVTIDEQMRIVMVNPAAQRIFGRSAAEMIGRSLDELMPERFRQRHRDHVQAFMRSDVIERPTHRSAALVGLRANGEEFPFEAAICKTDMVTDSGVQRCCTALLRDRSEEARLTQTIETFGQQMRLLFELAPIAIWIVDAKRVVFANRACSDLFGLGTPEAMVGRNIDELIAIEPHRGKVDWLREGKASDHPGATRSARITRSDGSLREVDIAVAEMPDHGRTFAQMVIVDTTERTSERRRLLRSRHLLRGLSASIVDAREEERQRIARELHDELGQRLLALKLELSAFTRQPSGLQLPGPITQPGQHMIDMVDDTVSSIRRITMGLRPPMLDDLGLAAAVEWLVSDFQRRTAMRVDLALEPLVQPLPATVSIAIYRILQEALTNITRHAGAQRVRIELAQQGAWVQLTVQDDGQGFAANGAVVKKGSFGLIGIDERVRMLGGQLQIKNASGGGARLWVRLPLDEREQLRPLEGDDSLPSDSRPSPLSSWDAS